MRQSTPKDKSLGQSTIHKVHHRMRRLEREQHDQQRQLHSAEQQLRLVDQDVSQEKQALLAARDEENELVLRFVQAKLLHELLCDDKASLDDDIVQLRRDIAAFEGDLHVKERTRFRLAAVEQQRQNEVDASEQYRNDCQRQARTTLESCREAMKQLERTNRMVREEQVHYSVMEDRLNSLKESVSAAVEASNTGVGRVGGAAAAQTSS